MWVFVVWCLGDSCERVLLYPAPVLNWECATQYPQFGRDALRDHPPPKVVQAVVCVPVLGAPT